MRLNYKKLGEYIQQVDIRNTQEKEDNLLGVSVTKVFIKSIANTVGTDFSKYRIVKRGQFTYIPDTSRRGDKIGIALLENIDEGLVSQAYTVFEVIDETKLLPQYLMMWFRRPEFDRYARYMSYGSVREIYSWDDMCDMELPIPSPEKQLEIVNEYQIIINRIKHSEQLIQKLEETAQTVYKEWFVAFEFPNEEGKPYKSSGGEMVESELGEIPKGWSVKPFTDVCDIKAGGDKPNVFSEIKTNICQIPIYSNGITNEGLYGYTNKYNYPKNSITISARGTIGFCVLRKEDFDAIVRLLVLIPKYPNSAIFLWQTIKKIEFDNSGSVQNQLTIPQVSVINILFPDLEVLKQYNSILCLIYNYIELKTNEKQKLSELKDLLLAKLATI